MGRPFSYLSVALGFSALLAQTLVLAPAYADDADLEAAFQDLESDTPTDPTRGEVSELDSPPVDPVEPAPGQKSQAFRKHWFEEKDASLGRFVAVRLGMGGGGSLLPRYGVDTSRVARAPLTSVTPYLGFEVGYGPKYRKWALGLGFDLGFLPATPTFLSSPPYHLQGTATFHWQTSDRLRLGFGFNFLSFVRMAYPSGQVLIAQGYGLRMTVYRPIEWVFTKTAPLEAFFSLSADIFRSVNGNLGGGSQVYSMSDFVGDGQLSHKWLFMAGLQVRFPMNQSR